MNKQPASKILRRWPTIESDQATEVSADADANLAKEANRSHHEDNTPFIAPPWQFSATC